MSSFNLEMNDNVIEAFFNSVEEAEGMVVYEAPYAVYVEVDTSYDSKKPPLQPLKEWTRRNITDDEDEVESVAYAIQNKIYKKGSEGEYFLLMTKNDWETKWKDVAEDKDIDNNPEAPEIIVKEILEGILSDSKQRLKDSGKDDTGKLINSGVVLMGDDTDGTEEMDIDDIV